MESVLITIAVLAWIVLRLSLTNWVAQRANGLHNVPISTTLTLNRYGLHFCRGYVWCESPDELAERLAQVVKTHIVVQTLATALSAALAYFALVGNWTDLWKSALLGLTIIEGVWLVANLVVTESGWLADLKSRRQMPKATTATVALGILMFRHATHRPRNWPRDLVDVLFWPMEHLATATMAATYGYTWANDSGDEQAKAAAIAKIEEGLEDFTISTAQRRIATALLAFDLASRGEVAKAKAFLSLKETEKLDAWEEVTWAWIDAREGRNEDASVRLDRVWQLVADSPDLEPYVLEQNRRIVPAWSPPGHID